MHLFSSTMAPGSRNRGLSAGSDGASSMHTGGSTKAAGDYNLMQAQNFPAEEDPMNLTHVNGFEQADVTQTNFTHLPSETDIPVSNWATQPSPYELLPSNDNTFSARRDEASVLTKP